MQEERSEAWEQRQALSSVRLLDETLPEISLVDWWTNPDPHQELKEHDAHEILFVVSGSGTFQVGGEIHSIEQNDVFIIHPHVAHGYIQNSSFECIELQFRFKDIKHIVRELDRSQGMNYNNRVYDFLHSEYRLASKFHLKDGNQLISRILTLHSEYRSHQPGRESLLSLYFMEILILLSRHVLRERLTESENISNSPRDQQLVQEIIMEIEKSYTSALRIDSLLEKFNLHPDYCREIFKRESGLSISQFLLRRRMLEARRLVVETGMPLKAVVTQVGLEDYFYFIRAFKKHFGVSPGYLRKTTAH